MDKMIQSFLTDVMKMTNEDATTAVMRRVMAETISKWEEWKASKDIEDIKDI